MRAKRWSMREAAEQIGVRHQHLSGSVYGHVRPSEVVREKLPALLGVPLDELFTHDVLRVPYRGASGTMGRPYKSSTVSE